MKTCFFFLLTLSFGMTKSASQCVNLECVIARSEKLRFRSALVSHSRQTLNFFVHFFGIRLEVEIDIYCCQIIIILALRDRAGLPLPQVTEQHLGSPLEDSV